MANLTRWPVEKRDVLIEDGDSSVPNLGTRDLARLQHALTGDNPHTPRDICQGGEVPTVIAFVESSPDRREWRDFIRSSWGKPSGGQHEKVGNDTMAVFFTIGQAVFPRRQKAVLDEIKKHGDILLTDLQEPNNDTFKHLRALKWVVENCEEAKFVLKAEDNVLVNSVSFLRHISDLVRTHKAQSLLACEVMDLSAESPRPAKHCENSAFFLSLESAQRLCKAADELRNPATFANNLWLTGLLPKVAKLQLLDVSRTFLNGVNRTREHLIGDAWYQYLFSTVGSAELKTFKDVWPKLVTLHKNRPIPRAKRILPGVVVANKFAPKNPKDMAHNH